LRGFVWQFVGGDERNIDEITKREPYDGYLVYQGGVPEVEEFVKKVRK
jgi:hypothetical protein